MGWGTPPLNEISLVLSAHLSKFGRKWLTETAFWIKLVKSRKRKMRARKGNEIRRVQKKGRRETRRRLARGHKKRLWERDRHAPGSEAGQRVSGRAAEEGRAGPLAHLVS